MIYMLGAALAGLRLPRGPSALTAVLNILAFDFFFVPPRYHFQVELSGYFVTFATMLIVALIIANLMISVPSRPKRRRHASVTPRPSMPSPATWSWRRSRVMIRTATGHIGELLHCQAQVLMCEPGAPMPTGAQAARALPLRGLQGTIAVFLVEIAEGAPLTGEQQRLLEAIADQLAIALERARMSQEAHQAQLEAERTSIRNTLLASISHDLRTPLSALASAAVWWRSPNSRSMHTGA